MLPHQKKNVFASLLLLAEVKWAAFVSKSNVVMLSHGEHTESEFVSSGS